MPDSALTTFLGFDFGLGHIGIAIGQTTTFSARPLTILKATQGVPQWQEIESLIKEWRIQACVVGLPLTADGQPLAITPAAEQFGSELHHRFHLPVMFEQEQYTTKSAKQFLAEHTEISRKAYDKVDDFAAAIILQAYFNQLAMTDPDE